MITNDICNDVSAKVNAVVALMGKPAPGPGLTSLGGTVVKALDDLHAMMLRDKGAEILERANLHARAI